MNNARRSNRRGKLLAIALLAMGLIAAVAEWKFRPLLRPRANPAATMPATHP